MTDTRSTIRAIFNGLVESSGREHPRLSYTVRAERPDGKVRHISSAVAVPDPEDRSRLRGEFDIGDEIELVLLTGWARPGVPVTLVGFSKPPASASG